MLQKRKKKERAREITHYFLVWCAPVPLQVLLITPCLAEHYLIPPPSLNMSFLSSISPSLPTCFSSTSYLSAWRRARKLNHSNWETAAERRAGKTKKKKTRQDETEWWRLTVTVVAVRGRMLPQDGLPLSTFTTFCNQSTYPEKKHNVGVKVLKSLN